METAKKFDSSKVVLVIMALLMALTAVYMTFVVKTVPRSVDSSKIGPFPELVDQLIVFHNSEVDPQAPSLNEVAVNAELKRLVPYEGLALKREAPDYQLLYASKTEIKGREILQLKMKHVDGEVFSISMYPIAKRHFPKTPSFVHKNSWFFQYGRDLMGVTDIPPTAHIPRLEQAGLNMIATNYGNDYYIMLTGTAPATDMAKWLFKSTTIFSPKK